LLLNLQTVHPAGPQQVTDLAHLNAWRNRAAHQGTQPLGHGVPTALTLPIVQSWRASCDGLATSLRRHHACRTTPHPGRSSLVKSRPKGVANDHTEPG
jgi:hypothetical protein